MRLQQFLLYHHLYPQSCFLGELPHLCQYPVQQPLVQTACTHLYLQRVQPSRAPRESPPLCYPKECTPLHEAMERRNVFCFYWPSLSYRESSVRQQQSRQSLRHEVGEWCEYYHEFSHAFVLLFLPKQSFYLFCGRALLSMARQAISFRSYLR